MGNATLEAPTFRFHLDLEYFFRIAESGFVWVRCDMLMVKEGVVCLRDCRLNNLGSRAGKLTGWECGQARHALVRHSTATCGAYPTRLALMSLITRDLTVAVPSSSYHQHEHQV